MIAHNSDLTDDRRIRFRVGINVGDVIEDEGDIFGDGVNIAARLQTISEPDGVCISQQVLDQVENKLPLEYRDLGAQHLRNISKPVHAYQVAMDAGTSGGKGGGAGAGPRAWKRFAVPALALSLVAAAGLIAWSKLWPTSPEPIVAENAAKSAAKSAAENAAEDAVESGALSLPDRPSIAVLPFENMSDASEQEHFADGLTNDLITDLSKISGIFVIARNSVFTYKGQAVMVQKVAKELGVRYVLEGSVRRANGNVRINAQLVDARNGRHLWAERYDRDYKDIFVLQDEVIGKIVSVLAVTLTSSERTRLARRPTDDLEAYDYYLRAEQRMYGYALSSRADAISLYEKAIELDPKFAAAHAGIAMAAVDIWRYEYSHSLPGPVARKRAYIAASAALNLDPRNARAFSVLGVLRMVEGRYDEAIEAVRLAVSLDPSNPEAYVHLATVLTFAGEHQDALVAMETALRLNPKPPPYYLQELGSVLFHNRRYAKALEPLEKARAGGIGGLHTLAMVLARLGRVDEAGTQVKELLRRVPFANLAYYRALHQHYRLNQDLEHRIDSLSKAGLPAWPFGYKGHLEDRLDTPALRKLTFGRTWFGRGKDGAPFVQQISDDGAAAFRNNVSLMTGTAWIEGGMLCVHFPATLVSRKSCSYVFRNPEGAAETGDEYVQVGVGNVLYFSTKP